MSNIIYLAGDPKFENLRAELSGRDVSFISTELANVSSLTNTMKERIFFTISLEVLREILTEFEIASS